MTGREYLNQGYRLKQRIRLQKQKIEELRELSRSISSPGFGEHYNASKNVDAPFEKVLLKIFAQEAEQAKILDILLTLEEEMTKVIDTVEDIDLRMVLHYRYLCNWTWSRIGDELGWDERTIRRWHNKALSQVRLPEKITEIK